jgi:hypothetical protein
MQTQENWPAWVLEYPAGNKLPQKHLLKKNVIQLLPHKLKYLARKKVTSILYILFTYARAGVAQSV